MKKFLLLGLFSLLFLTGCSSYTELNQLGIVSLLGIDVEDSQYHVYINLIEPQQDNNEQTQSYSFYEATGSSIEEAIHRLYLKSHKKIYLSHMDALLLTKEAIDTKLKEIIQYLLRSREIRNNFELMETDSSLTQFFETGIEAKEMINLVRTNELYMGTSQKITFEKFLENLLIDTNTTIPTITYHDDLEVGGLCLIQNFKTMDTLQPNEVILLNLLENNLHESIYQNVSIYQSETSLEYQKNEVIFHLYLEVNQNKDTLKTKLEEDLRRLLFYYDEKGYDLMKLGQKMKENRLLSINDSNEQKRKISLRFDIKIKVTENYLEKER